jgi:hypothetical protein
MPFKQVQSVHGNVAQSNNVQEDNQDNGSRMIRCKTRMKLALPKAGGQPLRTEQLSVDQLARAGVAGAGVSGLPMCLDT